jgi:hypothetical protein
LGASLGGGFDCELETERPTSNRGAGLDTDPCLETVGARSDDVAAGRAGTACVLDEEAVTRLMSSLVALGGCGFADVVDTALGLGTTLGASLGTPAVDRDKIVDDVTGGARAGGRTGAAVEREIPDECVISSCCFT